MDEHGQRSRMLGRGLTRRRLLQGSLAAGGALAAAATTSGRRSTRSAWAAQGTPASGFTREASITSWGFGTENVLAAARVEAFQAAFPNIELEVVPQATNEQILTAAASDTLPDVIWLGRTTTADWAARGVLMPLTEFIERDGYDTSRFYEAALNEASYDGQIYGIPGGMDVSPLYVNLDHLTEAGIDPATIDTSNWDQLNELGQQLVRVNGDVVERWGFDNKLDSGFISLWGPGNGGDFLSDDAQEATFDDAELVDALTWGVATFDLQGGYQLLEAAKTGWPGDEAFAQGLVSMTGYQSWMLGIIASTAPDLNFRVLPIRERGGEAMTSVTGGNAWYIPEGAGDPEAAWEFIKFLHTDETWLLGARARKEDAQANNRPFIPALTGSQTADRAQIEQLYEPIAAPFDEAVRLFPDLLAASHNREIANSPAAVALEEALQQEGVMPALRKSKEPQEALEDADTAAQDAIDSV